MLCTVLKQLEYTPAKRKGRFNDRHQVHLRTTLYYFPKGKEKTSTMKEKKEKNKKNESNKYEPMGKHCRCFKS
jgi:hypothetical protein